VAECFFLQTRAASRVFSIKSRGGGAFIAVLWCVTEFEHSFDLELMNEFVSIEILILDSFGLLMRNHYFSPNTYKITPNSILILWSIF
jgi:hypothetical protein